MATIRVLDKHLKIIRPGLRCRFRDLTMRKRNGEQVRMVVQGDTALVESVAPGVIRLKADRPVLTALTVSDLSISRLSGTNSCLQVEELDQIFTFKTKYVKRFKAWMAQSNKDGIELFVELLD